jgi:hypothetical protein
MLKALADEAKLSVLAFLCHFGGIYKLRLFCCLEKNKIVMI